MQHQSFFDSLFCAVRVLGVEEFTTENNEHHFRFRRVARLLDSLASLERGKWPRFFSMPIIGLYHDLDQYLLIAYQSGTIGFTYRSPIVRILLIEQKATQRLDELGEQRKA